MHVHETFEHVRKALELRERLLTRQIDVLVNTTPRPNARSNSGRPLPLIDQLKFMPQNETAVLEHIRRLGKFNVDNYKFYADPTFAIEDYICPNADHELMYKCLQNGNADADDIELDFSSPTAMPRGGDIEQQIVQMTVAESQELIAKARRPDGGGGQQKTVVMVAVDQQQEQLDNATDEQRIAKMLIDNLSSDHQHLTADAANTTPAAKSKKSKRRGKNGNGGGCGGTINLKNISSLTINTMCSRENSVKKSSKAAAAAAAASAPSTPSTTTATSSVVAPLGPPPKSHSDVIMDTHSTMENTSNAISDSHGASDGPIDYGCEFYNRLIAEIKHTMKATPTVCNTPQTNRQLLSATTSPSTSSFSAATTPTSSIAATTSSSSGTPAALLSPSPNAAIVHECSKMLFQNIRNLKITLPPASVAKINTRRSADGQAEQPVQIEEWLKQIISEPEVEPSPGADILEHSLIHEPVRAVE